MTAFEQLGEYGQLQMADESEDLITSYVGRNRLAAQTLDFVDETWGTESAELLRLSAAEVAISLPLGLFKMDDDRFASLQNEPKTINPGMARFAVAKWDCGWFTTHRIKRQLADVKLWDTCLYAGDMSKLESIGASDAEVLYHDMENVVDRLKQGFAAPDYPIDASGIGYRPTSRMIDSLGAAWLGKLSIYNGDGDLGDSRVRQYLGSVQ